MDLKIRAMRLHTAITKEVPGLGCDVRVSEKIVATPTTKPAWLVLDPLVGFDVKMIVVTVTLWGKGPNGTVREPEFVERHKAHELIAVEFWQELAQHTLMSIQVV
jgi:hypothetical protein